jgi:hypothetical protein
MLCAFKMFLRQTTHHARNRHQRRCIPSFTESATCLEDRVLLSAAGGMAHTAEIARNPVDTKVGREVTNLFESVLHTNPTSAQLTQSVRELRSGMSVVALRKDLIAEARAQQGARARPSMNAVVINGDPSAPAMASTRTAATGAIIPGSLMPGLSAPTKRAGATGAIIPVSLMPGLSFPTDTNVSRIKLSQIPAGMIVSRSFASGSGRTMSFSFGGPAGSSMSGTMSPASTMTGMSSTTMTGMSSTTMTGMSMSSIGSMSSTQAAFADLGASTTMMTTGM